MIACICGFVIEGLVLLGALSFASLSVPLTGWYNRWCRK